MKQPFTKLRFLWKPLQQIGAVYLLFFAYQIAFLLLWQLLKQLLNLPLELGKVGAGSPLPDLLTYLFLGFLPLILGIYTAKRFVFRYRFLPRFFPSHPFVLKDTIFGLLLGLVLFASLFFVFNGLGWIEVSGGTGQPLLDRDFYLLFLTFFVAALFEEVFYRGVHLTVFTTYWGLPAGIAFSSFFFSLAHLHNPNLSFLGLFGILIAGVFFATAYLMTGSLHLAVALHLSWNLGETLFGFQVSGLSFPSYSFFSLKLTGPELWTGGMFGPEGGLSGIGLMLLGTVAVFLYAKYSRKKRPISPVKSNPRQV